ncbi:hypothetical protein AX14_009599 [Amanita brunnescens Koide BX004]|nr:hypothetical protein AX14_009599 [Amanita brunnescens Koide BX004]
MMSLAEEANTLKGLWPAAAQLPGFFRSLVTQQGHDHHIPRFHGIPKIHKTPTGMRPIIPCHSAIQNPAASFVAKFLKPIVASIGTILQSSRQFCRELKDITIPSGKRYYFVSGDVVAYYPNVALDNALDIIKTVARVYYERKRDVPNDHLVWGVFDHAVEVGNRNLISQFNGKYYKQLKGLAMGVSDSPDIANLYSFRFSRHC